MVDVWVCNSSPLIALARIQRLDLIESLRAYGEAAPRTAPEFTEVNEERRRRRREPDARIVGRR